MVKYVHVVCVGRRVLSIFCVEYVVCAFISVCVGCGELGCVFKHMLMLCVFGVVALPVCVDYVECVCVFISVRLFVAKIYLCAQCAGVLAACSEGLCGGMWSFSCAQVSVWGLQRYCVGALRMCAGGINRACMRVLLTCRGSCMHDYITHCRAVYEFI